MANRPYNGWGQAISGTAYSNRFLFTGREYAPRFSIYEYRARAYNPRLGRFTSEDPKGFDAGDYNLFRYCHNDPLDLTDPMGLVGVEKEQFLIKPNDDIVRFVRTGSNTVTTVHLNDAKSVENALASGISAGQLSRAMAAANAAGRARIDRIASSMNGDQSYRQDVPKDDFAARLPKCNKLVDDVLRKAVVTRFRVRDEGGYIRAANTQEMATRAWLDWTRVAKGERSGGDVAVFGPARGERYGHTGFIISDGKGGLTNISAHADGVYPKPMQFENRTDTIYLRYTGD